MHLPVHAFLPVLSAHALHLGGQALFFLTDRLLRGMSLERHNPQQLQLQVPIEHLSPELQTILWQLRLFLLQSDDRVNPFSLNKWLDCLV